MTIKTFRGQLGDGEQIEINLRTNQGKIGYRIKKFEIIDGVPGTINAELVCKIYTEKQTTAVDGVVNFEDTSLLGVAYYTRAQSMQPIIFFDNVIFNQNIFITGIDIGAAAVTNYYIELEQVKLNDNESTMATLQSIRSRYESYTPAGPT